METEKIPTTLGVYRHYKGNEYEVIGFAKHSETLEDMVIYKALYGEGGTWVRPLSMWENPVEISGKLVSSWSQIPLSDIAKMICRRAFRICKNCCRKMIMTNCSS